MKKTLLSLLIHGLSFASFAQTSAVSGLVKTQQNEAVGFAAVSINQSKDSTLVKADVADEHGTFKIGGIPDGRYFVRVSAVGQQMYSSAVFDVAGRDVTLPTISMLAEAKQLNEVKVSGSKPLIEVKNDRMIFNVEASINATGSNALDLLQRSPGVQVDRDENILVRGKTGVRIYIDGRPSPLAGKDLASTLKSMNLQTSRLLRLSPIHPPNSTRQATWVSSISV